MWRKFHSCKRTYFFTILPQHLLSKCRLHLHHLTASRHPHHAENYQHGHWVWRFLYSFWMQVWLPWDQGWCLRACSSHKSVLWWWTIYLFFHGSSTHACNKYFSSLHSCINNPRKRVVEVHKLETAENSLIICSVHTAPEAEVNQSWVSKENSNRAWTYK